MWVRLPSTVDDTHLWQVIVPLEFEQTYKAAVDIETEGELEPRDNKNTTTAVLEA